MSQPTSNHHPIAGPNGIPTDGDYADGYLDALFHEATRAARDTSAEAADEHYRRGYWQGQQRRKHCRLQLRDDGHGGRYYLDGRPVHNGEQLEIQFADGQWRRLRLEGLPGEILAYGLLPPLAGGYELVTKVPLKALLRWPAVS